MDDWSVRTDDPSEASLFYIPALNYHYSGNLGAAQQHMKNVIRCGGRRPEDGGKAEGGRSAARCILIAMRCVSVGPTSARQPSQCTASERIAPDEDTAAAQHT